MIDKYRTSAEWPQDKFTSQELRDLYEYASGDIGQSSFVCRDEEGWAYGLADLGSGPSLFKVRDRAHVDIDALEFCRVTGANIEDFYPSDRFTSEEFYLISSENSDMHRNSFVARDSLGWAYGRTSSGFCFKLRHREVKYISSVDFQDFLRQQG